MTPKTADVHQELASALGALDVHPDPAWREPSASATRCYSLYGLTVASEAPLPVPEAELAKQTPVDLNIRWGRGGSPVVSPTWSLIAETRCQCPVHQGGVVTQLFRSSEIAWIWSASAGWFRIAADARLIEVYADFGADERELAIVLLGQVLVYALQRRGRPCLHASAISVNGNAVAFLGANGRGKSTMAACFLAHGAELLTDDVLPLRLVRNRVDAAPGVPVLKLWRESLEHTLHLSETLPAVTPTNDKSMLALGERYTFASAPVPLRAVYVLGSTDTVGLRDHSSAEVSIAPLGGRESMALLLASIALRDYLAPAEGSRFMPALVRLIGQVRFRLIDFPRGFEYQEKVYQRILADIAEGDAA